jgi:DNA mismatch endonuclease Vsr
MADFVTPEKRSKIMASIRAKDTEPELTVRRMLHSAGYRYRKHVSSLPGRPDLVFPRLRIAIFVDGDFWHGWHGRAELCVSGRMRPSRRPVALYVSCCANEGGHYRPACARHMVRQ